MNTTVGVFSTHQEAEDAINELRAFGVPESNLSYLYVDVDGRIRDDIGGKKVGSGAATGLAAGGIIGALSKIGIDSTDAALYQSLVERGDVFVVAKTEDLVTKDVFIKGGAKGDREYTGV